MTLLPPVGRRRHGLGLQPVARDQLGQEIGPLQVDADASPRTTPRSRQGHVGAHPRRDARVVHQGVEPAEACKRLVDEARAVRRGSRCRPGSRRKPGSGDLAARRQRSAVSSAAAALRDIVDHERAALLRQLQRDAAAKAAAGACHKNSGGSCHRGRVYGKARASMRILPPSASTYSARLAYAGGRRKGGRPSPASGGSSERAAGPSGAGTSARSSFGPGPRPPPRHPRPGSPAPAAPLPGRGGAASAAGPG